MARDKRGMKENISKLADEISLDTELIDCLVNLGISDFNPSDFQKQSSFGKV